MSNESATERAEFLSQMAPNPSVTAAVLTDDEATFADSRLVGDPPVTYLEDSEAPAFVLTNEKRGMATGGKHNRTKPDRGRGAIALVTGRRTLCLVGAEPDDKALEIPHTDVATVTAHTGFLAHRLEVRTTRRVYHCWVARSTDTQILADAAAYIDDRAGADLAELEPDGMPSGDAGEQFTYRGKVVTQSPTTDGGATDSTAETDVPGQDRDAADPGDVRAAPERVCRNCGEQLDEAVNFCPTCGTELAATDADAHREGDGTDEAESDTDTVMYRGREVDRSYLE